MSTRPPLPHRRRAWLLGVLAPILITAAAWVVILSVLPRLPDVVALHWGPSGVDRVGTATELLLWSAVMSGLSLLLMAVLSLATGRQALTRRMTLGLAVGLATMFALTSLATVLPQVDAATATEAGSPVGWLTGAIAAAILLGGAAAAMAGADAPQPSRSAVPRDLPRTMLAADQRAAWSKEVTALGEAATWTILLVGTIAAVGLSLLTATLFPLVIALPLLALVLGFMRWHVAVDSRGLIAKGTFGWPRLRVPAEEIDAARVVAVRPLREFGGWGLRTNVEGTVGVVVRRGEAIMVERTGNRRIVVTVDDAATGAALLNTFAERARAVTPQ